MEEKHQKKSAAKRILVIVSLVLCIILIPVLIVNTTLLVKSFLYPDKVPDFMGYKPFIVLSGSMEPVFFPGDLVLMKEVSVDTLEEMDIIAFRMGDSVITHRIIEINNVDGAPRYVTKGDNNNIADTVAVLPQMVEGRFILSISKLGNFALFMQTPAGMVIFVVVPLILYIFYDIMRRRAIYKKEKQKTSDLEAELERLRTLSASVAATEYNKEEAK